jgi:stage II sporulation protein AA (anti-sigma F factor antagonist)
LEILNCICENCLMLSDNGFRQKPPFFDGGIRAVVMEGLSAFWGRRYSHLTVKVEEKDGVFVAWLSGDLDHHAAEDVRRELDSALVRKKGGRVVLDMSRLTFMDSSGIGVVLGRYRKVKEAGGRLTVRAPSAKTDRLLRLAGIYTVIEKE